MIRNTTIVTVWRYPDSWNLFFTKPAQKNLIHLYENSKNWKAILNYFDSQYTTFEELNTDLENEPICYFSHLIGKQYFNL